MNPWPKHSTIYEINTRVWLREEYTGWQCHARLVVGEPTGAK